MKNVYVIMKQAKSPISITQQYPHEVVQGRKDADRRVDELNAKATTNQYWHERVPMQTGT